MEAIAAYLVCRGKSMLLQTAMSVVFVLAEKITLVSRKVEGCVNT